MAEGGSLSELRAAQSKASFSERFRQKAPWLFNWKSLFYFFWFVFLLGILWMIYSLFTNSMTQLYGWDYTWQYIDFTYEYYDSWHTFFRTGYFPLYSTGTYLGSDAIGSNSYYGLFDPFLFICYLFPRAWIPQTFATATIVKAAVSALFMRAYLRYMGCQETTSRLGAVAYAFCGYVNFFVGYPSFVSMCFTVPLILLGIEKVLKERKPSCLIWGLFFLGIISFFFLVVVCIWGVLYALWRFFWTIKSRSGKENWAAISLGIASFAVGIMLSCWTLFPSLRESTLSGRTTSIGSLYLAQIKSSLKGFDLKSFFALMFAEVGGNNAREIQPLTAFFFPTVNYLWSPLLRGNTDNHYDAWTSSLFVYTPFLILFFTALVSSFRRKKVSHLVAFALCCYLLFTNFAYFFFYAFTGDGYGRWYIVLIPEIIYYGAQELDRLKDEPKWVLPVGSFVSLFLTILTWVLTVVLVKDQTFAANGYTYVQPHYSVPGYVEEGGIMYSCLWMVYYQIGLVVIESVVMFYFQHKTYFWAILTGFVMVELIVCGNCSFAYGSSYSYEYWYDGGVTNAQTLTDQFATINAADSSYFRSYVDTQNSSSNGQNHFGFNGTSNFHSLYNFDVAQLSRYSHITGNATDPGSIYSSEYYGAVWSAYYGNKRLDFDTALSLKYYGIEKDTYSPASAGWNNYADNVPFDSVPVAQSDSSRYLLYRNPNVGDATSTMIGHAVSSDQLYSAGVGLGHNEDRFYSTWTSDGGSEIIRNEGLYLNGAIIQNDDVESLASESLSVKDELPRAYDPVGTTTPTSVSRMTAVKYSGKILTTNFTYFNKDGPAAMFIDPSTVTETTYATSGSYTPDFDKFVYYPYGNDGGAFNDDIGGAYYLIWYPGQPTRIYMIGDALDSEGNVQSNQLLCYDYNMMSHFSSHTNTSTGALFGFYAKGRVRDIVFCAEPSYSTTASLPLGIQIYKMERSVYDAQIKEVQDSALTNVKHWTDNFTCESDYDTKRLVVTSLGYDVGWRVIATDETGKSTHLKTYKLDGGFVGFVAPAGKVSYHLFFQTKYLKEGILLAMAGFGMYVLFEGIVFLKETRKAYREMGITLEKKPFDWRRFKKKKDDPGSSHKPNGP
jgi:hypothetical protein